MSHHRLLTHSWPEKISLCSFFFPYTPSSLSLSLSFIIIVIIMIILLFGTELTVNLTLLLLGYLPPHRLPIRPLASSPSSLFRSLKKRKKPKRSLTATSSMCLFPDQPKLRQKQTAKSGRFCCPWPILPAVKKKSKRIIQNL
jgi:hypothetical protein